MPLTEEEIDRALAEGRYVDARGPVPRLGPALRRQARDRGMTDAELLAELQRQDPLRSGIWAVVTRRPSWWRVCLTLSALALLGLIALLSWRGCA